LSSLEVLNFCLDAVSGVLVGRVDKVAETTINPAVSELYEYIKTRCGLHVSSPYATQYRSSER